MDAAMDSGTRLVSHLHQPPPRGLVPNYLKTMATTNTGIAGHIGSHRLSLFFLLFFNILDTCRA
jgi:hypothetical protein